MVVINLHFRYFSPITKQHTPHFSATYISALVCRIIMDLAENLWMPSGDLDFADTVIMFEYACVVLTILAALLNIVQYHINSAEGLYR